MKTSDVFSRVRPLKLAPLKSAIVALAVLLCCPPLAHSQSDPDEESELMSYDAIIRELSQGGVTRGQSARAPTDPFASVLLHGGVGLATTFGVFSHQGQRIQMNQRGFQAALGIDLLSENWLAEATARSFAREKYGRSDVSLKEFDLKLYYRNRFATQLGLRAGLGIAARYLNVASPSGVAEYTTPAMVAGLGLEYFLGRSVSFGAELSARNSLIDETIDRSAIDATFRVDTHF